MRTITIVFALLAVSTLATIEIPEVKLPTNFEFKATYMMCMLMSRQLEPFIHLSPVVKMDSINNRGMILQIEGSKQQTNETYSYDFNTGDIIYTVEEAGKPSQCHFSDKKFKFSLLELLQTAFDLKNGTLIYQGEIDLCYMEEKFHQFLMTVIVPDREEP